MSTDPKKARGDGSEQRPSGAESKGEARGGSGGHRTSAGSDYGDWVPERDQSRDDRDADPATGDNSGGGDPANLGKSPGAPDPQAADAAEATAESNRNKDFDTPHVHSSTTSRKV